MTFALAWVPLFTIQFSHRPIDFGTPWYPVHGDMRLISDWIIGLMRGEFVPFVRNDLSRMGAPFGPIHFSEGFPLTEQLQLLAMKFFTLFSKDPTVVWNLYFLSGYFLTALAFFLSAVSVGVLPPLAFGLSFAFTYLPFHSQRYEHLLVSQYWILAPAAAICIREFVGEKVVTRRHWILVAVFSFCISLWHSYFGFFFAGVFSLTCIVNGSWRNWRKFSLSLLAVVLPFLAAVSISALHYIIARRHALEPPPPFLRSPSDAILFSLRPWAVFNPIEDHRIPLLAVIRAYAMVGRGRIEGVTESIGTLGLVGFVLGCIEIFRFLKNKKRPKSRELGAGVLSFLTFIFASRVGIAVIVAYTVSAAFRSTNRISPMLAAACFFGIGLWISQRLDRVKKITNRRGLAVAIGIVLGAFAIWDTVLPAADVTEQGAALRATGHFVKKVEEIVGDGAVLQLPYAVFPEGGPIYAMYDYAHSEGPLFSEKTRWSYGTWTGTTGERVIRSVSSSPYDLAAIRKLGYSGIWIDRFGFPDSGKAVVSEIQRKLGRDPLASEDDRHVFFAL